MHDVFITHVEEDAEVALEIALGLEEVGYSTWCYEVDNIPGPSYLLQTGQRIDQAKAIVVVISPHSIGSRQVTSEVIRAHESGKKFIPVRKDISHIEFQNRQPEWREAIGSATSIGVPKEGAASILPRIIAGLKSLDIQTAMKADPARIEQISKAINELRVPIKEAELKHGAVEAAKAKANLAVHLERPAKALKDKVTTVLWFLIAGVLLCLGFIVLIICTVEYPSSTDPHPLQSFIIVMSICTAFLVAPGAYFLRRGIAKTHVSRLAEGKIPGWWWLLPIFLGSVGGMIAWIKGKNVDWHKASNLLTLGVVLSVLWVIPFLALQAPVSPSQEGEPGLIYEDDFSNTISGWPQESYEEAEGRYENGEYHIHVKAREWKYFLWSSLTGSFTDFALEIDARLVSGPNGSAYGLVFRVQNADNCYGFLVRGDGYYQVARYRNKTWTNLQGWTKSAFVNQGNSTNHLKVVCQGSQIEVYVNGHHLVTVTDDSFVWGYVGMIVYTYEPDVHAAFDNIEVYSLG
jgi:hypothetical protein